MKAAFYAPMKPVDHPVPSGDRQVARLIIRALGEIDVDVEIASTLRTWLRDPDRAAQSDLAGRSRQEVDRLLADWNGRGYRPDLWITYHLYHRAPDWIGPSVCDALHIPYVVIEASRAARRQHGSWSFGFAAAEAALKRADLVVYMHHKDRRGLAAVLPEERLMHLVPFIDTAPFAKIAKKRPATPHDPPRLLTVAMMRPGQKDRSYAALAEVMARLDDYPGRLTIAGDGDMRDAVLARFDTNRISYLGVKPADDMESVYLAGDLFIWTAVKEAYGLVFLEAQASGLPVVGSDAGGVPEIIRDGETGLITPEGDIDAFAGAVRALLADPVRTAAIGRAATEHVVKRHDIAVGRETLTTIVGRCLAGSGD